MNGERFDQGARVVDTRTTKGRAGVVIHDGRCGWGPCKWGDECVAVFFDDGFTTENRKRADLILEGVTS